MRELEKIKKEKAEQLKRKQMDEAEEEKRMKQEKLLTSNPLMNSEGGDYSMKKKWFDDSVFKNQARDEPVTKKRFINDTTRNDFARKFLTKYIK
eukprot:gene11572-13505_t